MNWQTLHHSSTLGDCDSFGVRYGTNRTRPKTCANKWVHAPPKVTRKRKPKNMPAPTIDTEVLLQEARTAKGGEAVQWFKRTILHPQRDELPSLQKQPCLTGASLACQLVIWQRHGPLRQGEMAASQGAMRAS